MGGPQFKGSAASSAAALRGVAISAAYPFESAEDEHSSASNPLHGRGHAVSLAPWMRLIGLIGQLDHPAQGSGALSARFSRVSCSAGGMTSPNAAAEAQGLR